MKKTVIAFTLLLCLGGMVFVQDSKAAFFKYIDQNGIVCFADNLQVIPEQYRANAVIVETEREEEIKPKPAKPAESNAPDAAATGLEEKGPRPLSTRMMISGAIGLGALVIFVALSNLSELKENKKILSLVRGSLIGVVSLYLVFAHVKDVMTIFGMAGHAVEEAQHKSKEKGKKAAQAIKSA